MATKKGNIDLSKVLHLNPSLEMNKPEKKRYYIGIDCGVNTGFAIWDSQEKKFTNIATIKIHTALFWIKLNTDLSNCKIIVEDARKRKWYGKDSEQKQQGAGSVKRDCKIWEDFLTEIGADFVMVHPIKGGTKIDKERFKKITGWNLSTSSHSRDASLLVFQK